jgi:hypothetical protein
VKEFINEYNPKYVVKLDFGVAFMQAKDVVSSEPVMDVVEAEEEESKDFDPRVVYGGCSLFYFLRFYDILYHRLLKAKELCSQKYITTQDAISVNSLFKNTSRMKFAYNPEGDFEQVVNCIGGLFFEEMDDELYAREIRSIIGHDSYFLLSMVKLVNNLLLQLSALASDSIGFIDNYQQTNIDGTLEVAG